VVRKEREVRIRSIAGYFWQFGNGAVINLAHVVAVDRMGEGRPDDQGRGPLRVVTTVPGVTYTVPHEHALDFIEALLATGDDRRT
jgi:hypothetical protein